jgi:hypothetical protein
MQHRDTITRRSVLAAGAATAVTGAGIVAPLASAEATEPDVELIQLVAQLDAQMEVCRVTSDAHMAAEEAYYEAKKAGREACDPGPAEGIWRASYERYGEIVDELIDAHPKDMRGLVFKAKLREKLTSSEIVNADPDAYRDFLESIVDDFIRIAEGV